MAEAPVVRVERRVAAPAGRVFDAWLDPLMIGRFMFGAHLREEEVVSLENEPHVGGRFHYKVMRAGQLIDHTGTYLEINRPHRLAFTWGVNQESGDSSVVTIEFSPDGDGCLLTLTHRMDAQWADYAGRTQQGWTKIVGDLASALA